MSEDSIAFDTVGDLCADRHRRIILATLRDEQHPLTVSDLAKAIVKHTDHVPVTEPPAEQMSELQTSLHHVHLPKIEATGLINYDQDRGVVEPTEQFEQVQQELSALIDVDPALESPLEL